MKFNRRRLLSMVAAPLFAQRREAESAALRIRAVDPYVLRIGGRSDLVFCRIETEDGIHGWGEGTTPPNVTPVVAQIRSLSVWAVSIVSFLFKRGDALIVA